MIEVVIHGRGGRGGVTLAKLLATAYFLKGKYVQAFGVYGAERAGAPVQAFVRVDDEEITTHNPIAAPDHVVIIDPSLIGAGRASGMKIGGAVVLNTEAEPGAFADVFPGRSVATVDANGIAVANRLGSPALPIVNTTILGAIAKVLGLQFSDVEAALTEAKFLGPNLEAARTAYELVRVEQLAGSILPARPETPLPALGFLDDAAGSLPTIRTGEWASHFPRERELTPVCNDGCPAGNDVRGFLQHAAKGDYTEALATILDTSPFPGTCGRVCPAPCMMACNRKLLDDAVNIRDVERAVADRGTWPIPTVPTRGERVAVVGSGPAGLSAAYHLARGGYPVTVFEADAEVGGVLRTGIPSYRLPREVLDREVDHIRRHGVEIKTAHPVDRTELGRLGREFAAVFVATGLKELRDLDVGAQSNGSVTQAIEFLDCARHDHIDLAGSKVVVVGGGNTAMDAARSALRLGAQDVRVVYRRTRAEMPAIAEEIDEAIEEGIQIDELLAPVCLRQGNDGTKLECRRMVLGEPDETGRRRPVQVAGDEAVISVDCDRLLLALGQSPDLSILPNACELKDCRALAGFGDTLVFAGGDFATQEGTVTAAIGSGRAAAENITAVLAGRVAAEQTEQRELAGPEVVVLQRFPVTPQNKCQLTPAAERRKSFAEVRHGLVDEHGDNAVNAEAARCLSCGACNECDTCIVFCPEGLLRADGPDPYSFDYDYCKGCGLCAAQCPRGAIVMGSCSEAVSQ
jgi:2-oxoacid:acceptor oxidoreductase gamma subunit (pyruvate/2-ketoisovalerate family)